MIKAIEIKSTEDCLYYAWFKAHNTKVAWCDKKSKPCVGLDSHDCPMNAVRCETCIAAVTKDYDSRIPDNCIKCHGVEICSKRAFCSAHEAKR